MNEIEKTIRDIVEVACALVILVVVVTILAAAVAVFTVVGALVWAALLLWDGITWIWRKS